MNAFYNSAELVELGFKNFGSNVLISKKASIYGASSISIGSNVRIDDFCILSGSITLGSNIHISAYSALYGARGIFLEDYTGISPRCTLFSAMDDFGGEYLIGPIHPVELTNVTGGPIILKRFVQIGAGTIIFPNITIEKGSVIGACSLVNKSVTEWGIYAGIPAKYKKQRKRKVETLV